VGLLSDETAHRFAIHLRLGIIPCSSSKRIDRNQFVARMGSYHAVIAMRRWICPVLGSGRTWAFFAVKVPRRLPKLETVGLVFQGERPRHGDGFLAAFGFEVPHRENPQLCPKEVTSVAKHNYYAAPRPCRTRG